MSLQLTNTCLVDVTLSIKLPRNSGLGEPGAIIHVGELDDDWLQSTRDLDKEGWDEHDPHDGA